MLRKTLLSILLLAVALVARADEKTKDYRRTLLWESNATVGDDGCITVELHNNSKETILLLDVSGVHGNKLFINNMLGNY
jgi:hypothetical protein